jgi:hypothetical protein
MADYHHFRNLRSAKRLHAKQNHDHHLYQNGGGEPRGQEKVSRKGHATKKKALSIVPDIIRRVLTMKNTHYYGKSGME